MTEEKARWIIKVYSGKITSAADANRLVEAIDAILIKYEHEEETNDD